MKKFILYFVIAFVAIYGISTLIADKSIKGGARGENIKVISATEATVTFYPVCPDCDHVSSPCSTNLSKGESHSTIHVCEKCGSVYDITIKR